MPPSPRASARDDGRGDLDRSTRPRAGPRLARDADEITRSTSRRRWRPILVVVASPQPSLGRRVAARLRAERNIEVVTSTASPQIALRVASRLSADDVAVVDESFNELLGRDLVKEVRDRTDAPGVVALLRTNDRNRAAQALLSGATGFVPVTASVDEVVHATLFVAQGLSWITQSLWSV